METGVKHVLREDIVVGYVDKDSKERKYLAYIYTSSCGWNSNISEAMKFPNIKAAMAAVTVANCFSSKFDENTIKVVRVATVVEDIDDTEISESI